MFYLFCVFCRKQDKSSLKLSNILGYEQEEIAEMSKILWEFSFQDFDFISSFSDIFRDCHNLFTQFLFCYET